MIAFSAIDNLWKGASGQGVQNLNLMLGLDETEGLPVSEGGFFKSRWVEPPAGVEELDPAHLAPGFRAGAAHCGLKGGGKTDVGLLVCDAEQVGSSILLTRNASAAAPVRVCRDRFERGAIRAAVVNAGNANAETGAAGIRRRRGDVRGGRGKLGLRQEAVAVAETGVIGVPLPIDAVLGGIGRRRGELSRSGGDGLLRRDPHHRPLAEALHAARRRRDALRPGQGRRDDPAELRDACSASSRPTPWSMTPTPPCGRPPTPPSSGSPSTAR